MSGFTVYGADGRRVVRGFAESAARELAARINASSGETLTVLADDEPFDTPVVADAPEGKRPLEDLSGKELKQLAEELGVTFAKRATRAQKIASLREALPEALPAAEEPETDAGADELDPAEPGGEDDTADPGGDTTD